MSYNIIERVQKCWMVFPAFLMKHRLLSHLHRLLSCYITFVQQIQEIHFSHNPSVVFLWSLQCPLGVILIWKYASCFRLFIQDRVLPLVFTSSSSSRRIEIIKAASRPSAISWVVYNILNEMLEDLFKPFKHGIWHVV